MSKGITADNVKLKRAYEPSAADDGARILIDRLWPRGVKKADAAIDEWIKDIAPSTALRKWFGHDPARWQEFRSRYAVEVHEHPARAGRRSVAVSFAPDLCTEKALRNQGPAMAYFR
jgi:uncharacterized protein YeaO (DUF488 family)